MPDLLHCVNEKCPLRERCWRFMAPFKEGDVMTEFRIIGDKCPYFYPFE
jgi:hypothetical protein